MKGFDFLFLDCFLDAFQKGCLKKIAREDFKVDCYFEKLKWGRNIGMGAGRIFLGVLQKGRRGFLDSCLFQAQMRSLAPSVALRKVMFFSFGLINIKNLGVTEGIKDKKLESPAQFKINLMQNLVRIKERGGRAS